MKAAQLAAMVALPTPLPLIVTPAAGTGAWISPDVQTVSAGGTLTFTATASGGYQLSGFTGSCRSRSGTNTQLLL